MKSDSRPGFLHLKYFRYLEHVGPSEDFKFGYRAKPKNTEEFDPLLNLKNELKSDFSCQLEKIENRINMQIDKSVKAAQAAPIPSKEELYTDVLV